MSYPGTAKEHLAWCIERAMEYAGAGDMANAWASFGSDVSKHDGTAYIARHELFGMRCCGRSRPVPGRRSSRTSCPAGRSPMPELETPALPAYPFTDEGLAAALDALGRNHVGVATTLLRLGFRGVACARAECPVAHYVEAALKASEVSVPGLQADAWMRPADDANGQVRHVYARCPAPVIDFIHMFDNGRYPSLDEVRTDA